MNTSKELHFDFYKAKIRAKTQKEIFKVLAHEAAPHCHMDFETLHDVFKERLSRRSFRIGDVAIFDATSHKIEHSAMGIVTFNKSVEFEALEDQSASIMAVVISPRAELSLHLQRLASVSRVMSVKELCSALHDARDEDTMRTLFMPSQDWMIAA